MEIFCLVLLKDIELHRLNNNIELVTNDENDCTKRNCCLVSLLLLVSIIRAAGMMESIR